MKAPKGLRLLVVSDAGERIRIGDGDVDVILTKGAWRIVDEQTFMLVATIANGNRVQIDTVSLDPAERRN